MDRNASVGRKVGAAISQAVSRRFFITDARFVSEMVLLSELFDFPLTVMSPTCLSTLITINLFLVKLSQDFYNYERKAKIWMPPAPIISTILTTSFFGLTVTSLRMPAFQRLNS